MCSGDGGDLDYLGYRGNCLTDRLTGLIVPRSATLIIENNRENQSLDYGRLPLSINLTTQKKKMKY